MHRRSRGWKLESAAEWWWWAQRKVMQRACEKRKTSQYTHINTHLDNLAHHQRPQLTTLFCRKHGTQEEQEGMDQEGKGQRRSQRVLIEEQRPTAESSWSQWCRYLYYCSTAVVNWLVVWLSLFYTNHRGLSWQSVIIPTIDLVPALLPGLVALVWWWWWWCLQEEVYFTKCDSLIEEEEHHRCWMLFFFSHTNINLLSSIWDLNSTYKKEKQTVFDKIYPSQPQKILVKCCHIFNPTLVLTFFSLLWNSPNRFVLLLLWIQMIDQQIHFKGETISHWSFQRQSDVSPVIKDEDDFMPTHAFTMCYCEWFRCSDKRCRHMMGFFFCVTALHVIWPVHCLFVLLNFTRIRQAGKTDKSVEVSWF